MKKSVLLVDDDSTFRGLVANLIKNKVSVSWKLMV